MSEVFKRSHMCGLLNMKNVGEDVVLNGWVAKQRRTWADETGALYRLPA